MSDYLDGLLKHKRAAGDTPGDGQVDPRMHDADGRQLTQSKNVTGNEPVNWDEVPKRLHLDLDLASTERRRAARSRTRKR
jgi:hypothetical protein